MALVLCRHYEDGSIEHSEFTKESWEDALRDPAVVRRMGHKPGECYDQLAKHWFDQRSKGYRLSPIQHHWADKWDSSWVGDRGLEQSPKIVPPPAGPPTEPIIWPPHGELTPQMLCELTTMCLTDARIVLGPPIKDGPPKPKEPVADKRGQYSLF
jgi:hypothetical protein